MSQLEVHQSWLDESIGSAQLVVGSVLGAFLGFSISQDGVINGDYWSLFELLFWVSAFVGLSINWARHFYTLSTGQALVAVAIFVILIGFAWQSKLAADQLSLDGMTLLVLLGTWMFLLIIEVIGSFYHRRRYKND